MKLLGWIAALTLATLSACTSLSGTAGSSRQAVVKLLGSKGQCTGVQVKAPSGREYIMSAAHCAVLAEDGSILAMRDGERPIPRRVVEVSPYTDLMLLEAMPELRGLQVADSLSEHQHVRSFGHGEGHDTQEGDGEALEENEILIPIHPYVGEEADPECQLPKEKLVSFFGPLKMCVLDLTEMASTTPISPGNSGGPLVDDSGKLVGIASASDDHFSEWVTLKDIQAMVKPY